MQLVSKQTPQSGPREAEDYITITWTVAAPEDLLISGKAARRHHILQRLVREAISQDARPTVNNLAAAVEVSRRTILRDLKELSLNL